MIKETKKHLYIALCLLTAFLLWTVLVSCVDVQAIGPRKSAVGFATMNVLFHDLTGVHMTLYTITDWLGLVPIGFMLGFAVLGLVQWVKRRKLRLVDLSILFLGGFYLVVLAVYLLFEEWVINYRPVLIEGILEASYPSSTTMLALCIMPTAIMQLHSRLGNCILKRSITGIMVVFTVFMVIGRFLSGVHWVSDIIGGILLSTGLVRMYAYLIYRTQ